MDQAARSAVAAETTSLGHKRVYFLECKQQVKGCSWHPDTTDARQISDSVVAFIKQITGWDTGEVDVSHKKTGYSAQKAVQIRAAQINSHTVLISSPPNTAGNQIRIVDAAGKLVERIQFDPSGVCRWNTANIPEGFYFVGGQKTGWVRVFIKQ